MQNFKTISNTLIVFVYHLLALDGIFLNLQQNFYCLGKKSLTLKFIISNKIYVSCNKVVVSCTVLFENHSDYQVHTVLLKVLEKMAISLFYLINLEAAKRIQKINGFSLTYFKCTRAYNYQSESLNFVFYQTLVYSDFDQLLLFFII